MLAYFVEYLHVLNILISYYLFWDIHNFLDMWLGTWPSTTWQLHSVQSQTQCLQVWQWHQNNEHLPIYM